MRKEKKNKIVKEGYKDCTNPECEMENPQLYSEFSKDRNKTDGLCSRCKSCNKKYYGEHKEEVAEKNRVYYEEHKEESAAYDKIYREEHKEELAEGKKKYYKENKEQICERQKGYCAEHKEQRNEGVKNRRKTDISFKLAGNSRSAVSKALKGGKKVGSAVRDRGCTDGELREYFKSKFYYNHRTGEVMELWMYGIREDGKEGWEIDHIIPLSEFNLEDREQFLKAVHYTNLQPLWRDDNCRKGTRIISFEDLMKEVKKDEK